MKKLLAAIVLAFGLALSTPTVHAQNAWNPGRISAYTMPNPALPIGITLFDVEPDGNGNVVISFSFTGIGQWQLWEVQPNSLCVFLCDGVASMSGQVYTVVVPSGNFVDCYIDTFNVHGWGGTWYPR